MKPFESVGIWFAPDAPDRQIPGTLRFSEEKGLELSLMGAFTEGWGTLGQYPVICGSVNDSPYGKFITLHDCFATSLQYGLPGAALESIHGNRAFAGDSYVESPSTLFSAVSLGFTVLGPWLNRSGVTIEHGSPDFRLSWSPPKLLECALPDAKLSVAFRLRTLGAPGASVSVEEAPSFRVVGFGESSDHEVHSRYVRPLAQLITFASDAYARIDQYSLELARGGLASTVNRLAPPVRTSDERSPMRPMDFLFTYDDISDRAEAFLNSWFRFVQAHPKFCRVFFSYAYDVRGFLETRFLFRMIAAQCLAAEMNKDVRCSTTSRLSGLKSSERRCALGSRCRRSESHPRRKSLHRCYSIDASEASSR